MDTAGSTLPTVTRLKENVMCLRIVLGLGGKWVPPEQLHVTEPVI